MISNGGHLFIMCVPLLQQISAEGSSTTFEASTNVFLLYFV